MDLKQTAGHHRPVRAGQNFLGVAAAIGVALSVSIGSHASVTVFKLLYPFTTECPSTSDPRICQRNGRVKLWVEFLDLVRGTFLPERDFQGPSTDFSQLPARLDSELSSRLTSTQFSAGFSNPSHPCFHTLGRNRFPRRG